MCLRRTILWSITALSLFAVSASIYANSGEDRSRAKPAVLPVSIALPKHPAEAKEAGEAEDESVSCDCQSVYEFTLELDDLRPTTRLWPPKRPKVYPPKWRASNRRGRRGVVTTLFAVHLKESMPILDNLLPPEEAFDELFRCRGFGEKHPVDKRLTETILAAARHFKAPRVEIISGYRSPKFNDSLAKKGRHVAVESKHTLGQAIDFRVTTAGAQDVGFWIWNHFDGGVGTYTKSNFVHIDTGDKRRWRGR